MMVLGAIAFGLLIVLMGSVGGSVAIVWIGIAVTLSGPIGYLACRDARGPCRHTEQPSSEQPSSEQPSSGGITVRVELSEKD